MMNQPRATAARRAGSGPKGSRWTVEYRRDDGALSAVAAEWRDLYDRCRTATPFQSHEWLDSWWREYGKSGRLRLILVRRDGLLVAAAAMMLTPRWSCAALAPMGDGISDLTDILVDDSCAPEATEQLASALLEETGWHVLDLPEVRPDGPAAAFAEVWPARQWRFAAATCLEITAKPLGEALVEVPGRTAHTIEKKLRKIDTMGIESRIVRPDEVAAAVEDLVRLHTAQWEGRGGNPEHLRPRFARHLTTALEAMVLADRAIVTRYAWEGRVVCCDILLLGHEFAGDYLYGIHPDLREKLDAYTMVLRDSLAHTHERGLPTLSQLRGTEPHKQRLRPRHVASSRILLAPRRGVRAVCYATAVRFRERARDLVRERLPLLRTWLTRVRRAIDDVLSRMAARR